jgi:1,4-alpha-glucan branching enzyme
MGWMHDTLKYFERDPIARRHIHHNLTFGLTYAWSENFILPFSHDEVVHMKGSMLNKMFGGREWKFANLRALYAYMWAHPGKKLLFMGCELAQWREWSEERSLDWHLLEEDEHRGVSTLVRDLNRLVREHPPLYELDVEPRGFQWVDVNNHMENVLAFMRQSEAGERVVCVSNFSAAPRPGYRFGLPEHGTYRLLLNTDSAYYSGGDRLHINCVETEEHPWHGLPFSAVVDLPPLTTLLFQSPAHNPGSGGEDPDACAAPAHDPPVPVDTGAPTPFSQQTQAPKARRRAPSKRKAAPAKGAESEVKKAPRKAAKRSPRRKADEEQSGE